jgi:hypothetical protein
VKTSSTEFEPLGERFADPTQDLMVRFGGTEDRRLDILVLKELIRGWVSAENIEGAHLQVVDVLLGPEPGVPDRANPFALRRWQLRERLSGTGRLPLELLHAPGIDLG